MKKSSACKALIIAFSLIASGCKSSSHEIKSSSVTITIPYTLSANWTWLSIPVMPIDSLSLKGKQYFILE